VESGILNAGHAAAVRRNVRPQTMAIRAAPRVEGEEKDRKVVE
jgi:hypothetical protein